MNGLKWAGCLVLAANFLGNAGSAVEAGQAEKLFRVGVYIYASPMEKAAADENTPIADFVDKHFKILSDHGVNGVYLGGAGPASLDAYLAAAAKHGIALIPQLDFAYFRGAWTEDQMDQNARKAGEFIAKHQNHPMILAWSVKEEVAHNEINMLARYYAKIQEFAPGARFNLIHSGLGAAQDQPVPDPVIIGTDRYGFWWEFSGGGYLASPAAALDWTRTEASRYYLEAARRGADYMFVVTQGGFVSVQWANALCKNPEETKYPKTPEERRRLQERALAYAKDNRMGWRKVTTDKGDFYAVWKYYRLPENCIKACAWASVLEGARLFYIWSYTPLSKDRLAEGGIAEMAAGSTTRKSQTWWTMAGRPGMPNRHLEELAETSKEIRAYEKIITRMAKIPGLTVKADSKQTFGQAFHVPTRPGIVIVLHNANVGTWPEGSRYFFKETDDIRIDDKGDMVGYTPYRDPAPVKFTIPEAMTQAAGKVEGVFDLATGEEIKPADGAYVAPVKPGSGRLV
ncbi:MAG TPA: hypothetical protein P5137_11820, partial [Candidatus Brocadiia bacterium]|nr:hypothetical protein [Candidatus Brocadiia bacterium]